MAKLIPTAFQSYELTEAEEREGKILNISVKYSLQNRMARYAQEKLYLIYDTKDPMSFLQKEAELQGQIRLLQELLDESEIAEEASSAFW